MGLGESQVIEPLRESEDGAGWGIRPALETKKRGSMMLNFASLFNTLLDSKDVGKFNDIANKTGGGIASKKSGCFTKKTATAKRDRINHWRTHGPEKFKRIMRDQGYFNPRKNKP